MPKKTSSKDDIEISTAANTERDEIDFLLEDKAFADAVIEGAEAELLGDSPTQNLDFDESVEISTAADVVGTELDAFESAEVEAIEEISQEQLMSAVESLLFASDRPQSAASLKAAFQGTKVRVADIRSAIERLQLEYANISRGVTVDEVAGGYQIRTKPENQKYIIRTVKARPFRLSGPALEVLAIVAYKQPCTKAMVDEVRGVESGHLMRGLLDRSLIQFAGKSEAPGRPMTYATTRKFLEIFNLRNINELPTLSEIDQLIPEGIGADIEEKPQLKDITGELSAEVQNRSYSEGEEELIDISSELKTIDTTTAFFEDEKRRAREKRDADRAQDLRERLTIGETLEEKDLRWLNKYEAEKATEASQGAVTSQEVTAGAAHDQTATDETAIRHEKVAEPEIN